MTKYLNIRLLSEKALIAFFLVTLVISSCSSEKEIEFDLPPFESELVVECYLEVGQPYILTLQESVSYFENFDLPPTVDDALVVISHGNVKDTLQYVVFGDVGVYVSFNLVPADYQNEFRLYIKDGQDREVFGTTQLLEPVPIDTLLLDYSEDGIARLEMRFSDDPGTNDWYQFVTHKNNFEEGDNFNLQLEDRFSGTSDFVLSTFFDYETGDTAIATLYHITEAYYNYIETIGGAQSSNGNPFAQPGSIKSTVTGGMGVFAGLTFDRKQIIVP